MTKSGVARLSSFSFFARSVLFLGSLYSFWQSVGRSRGAGSTGASLGQEAGFRWHGRVGGDVVFADRWAAVGAVVGSFLPHGNGSGEMTQCGASFIAAHCIVHRSALRLALQRSAFVACLSCYHRRSRFHEEIHRAGLFPDNCFGIRSNPFLPSFQFPSSRVSAFFSQSFSLLCPFSTAASLSSSIPFFPSAQVSFPFASTTFVGMKCLLPLVMHAGVWGHAVCSPDGSGVWRWGSRYGGID